MPDPETPVVLLVHGVTASSRTWWRVAPALVQAGWQVLAVDLRCHGASGCETLTEPWDIAEDVFETLTAELGTARVDVAWGHSLGGWTVMQLLARHPDVARRAMLEDPPGSLVRDSDERLATWRQEIELARTDPAQSLAEQRAQNPGVDERDLQNNVEGLKECRIEPIADEFAAGHPEAAGDLAPRLPVPVLLYLAAEAGSVLVGAEREKTVAALPPGSRVVELDGGHTLHRELPQAYLAAALDWLGHPISYS